MSVESSRNQEILNNHNRLIAAEQRTKGLFMMRSKLFLKDCFQRNYEICESNCLNANKGNDAGYASCFQKCESKRFQGCNQAFAIVSGKDTIESHIKNSKFQEVEYDL